MIAIMCYYPLNMPLTSQNDSAKCLDLTLLINATGAADII